MELSDARERNVSKLVVANGRGLPAEPPRSGYPG
jgi:hypothetical protein